MITMPQERLQNPAITAETITGTKPLSSDAGTAKGIAQDDEGRRKNEKRHGSKSFEARFVQQKEARGPLSENLIAGGKHSRDREPQN